MKLLIVEFIRQKLANRVTVDFIRLRISEFTAILICDAVRYPRTPVNENACAVTVNRRSRSPNGKTLAELAR